jgi:hypothetical protein
VRADGGQRRGGGAGRAAVEVLARGLAVRLVVAYVLLQRRAKLGTELRPPGGWMVETR